jgi:hypothetical protein
LTAIFLPNPKYVQVNRTGYAAVIGVRKKAMPQYGSFTQYFYLEKG